MRSPLVPVLCLVVLSSVAAAAPLLHVFGTYLGSSGFDNLSGLVVLGDGSVVVSGFTQGVDYPTLGNPLLHHPNLPSQLDVVVSRFTPAGALVASRVLGGASSDATWASARALDGSVVLVGYTASVDFPTAALVAPPVVNRSSLDVFVLVLSPDLGTIQASVVFGGSGYDWPHAAAVAPDGTILVAGQTESLDFPTTSPLMPRGAGWDGFVARVDPVAGVLLGAATVGGRSWDGAKGVAVDADGSVLLALATSSDDLPTRNAPQPAKAGASDAYFAKLTPDLLEVEFATYLGGWNEDAGTSVAFLPDGDAVLVGQSYSTDFPVVGAWGPKPGAYDLFVTRVDAATNAIDYSILVGGSQDDRAPRVTVDASGDLLVAATSYSPDFPVVDAVQAAQRRFDEVVAFRLASSGAGLLWSTYLGGSGSDEGKAIAPTPVGGAAVLGWSSSGDYPTTPGAYQPGNRGSWDATLSVLR